MINNKHFINIKKFLSTSHGKYNAKYFFKNIMYIWENRLYAKMSNIYTYMKKNVCFLFRRCFNVVQILDFGSGGIAIDSEIYASDVKANLGYREV